MDWPAATAAGSDKMARFNDLESGFEKTLALSYGRHIITGHPIEHSVGLEGGAATNIANADKRVALKIALGDGAPDVDGEGCWCGPDITIGGAGCEPASGMALWLKKSSLTGAEGDHIASWQDSSGNGFDLAQSDDSLRPLISADGGADFDPTKLLVGSDDPALNFPDGYTLFLVMRRAANDNYCSILGKLQDDYLGWEFDRKQRFGLIEHNNFLVGAARDYDAFGSDGWWYQVVSPGAFDDATHVFTVKVSHEGAVGTSRLTTRTDGFPVDSQRINGNNDNGSATMPPTSNSGAFYLGDTPLYGPGFGINGVIYEVILYPGALSDEAINQTEDYLRNLASIERPKRNYSVPTEVARVTHSNTWTGITVPAGTQEGDLMVMAIRWQGGTGGLDSDSIDWGYTSATLNSGRGWSSTGIAFNIQNSGPAIAADFRIRRAMGSGETFAFASWDYGSGRKFAPDHPFEVTIVTYRGLAVAGAGTPAFDGGWFELYNEAYGEAEGDASWNWNRVSPPGATADHVTDPIFAPYPNAMLYVATIDDTGAFTIESTVIDAGSTGNIARSGAANWSITAMMFEAESEADTSDPVPSCEGGDGVTISPGDACSMEVIYAGETIPPENVHFHAGTLSRGKNDPIQGIDSLFPNGFTYNGTAYLVVVLPDGVADDADPSKLVVLIYTSQLADYDESGVRTAIAYSPNPSRVKANMLRRIGQLARIYWPSFTHSRDYYDAEIEAPVSNANSYAAFDAAPTYDVVGPISADAGTGAITPTTGKISGYDNRAITQQRIVGGEDGGFHATLGGAFPTGTGGGEMSLIDEHGTAWFGISWGNGHLAILANEVPIDDITIPYDFPAVGGDTIELNVVGGYFILKQNGVIKAIPQGLAPAPIDVDLFGRIVLWQATAEVTASHFTGKATSATAVHTEMVKRFEAHPAFSGPVDIGTALDYVDSLCASDTQDAGRYIVFLTPEARTSVHTFDEDTNVVGKTIQFYTTDIRNRPNRLWAKFRNLDLRYLDQDSVFDLRDALFEKIGRPIDPGALNFGSMKSSQAQRLIRFEMRRRSDNKIFSNLTGMDDSFHVLPADVVTVLSYKIRVKVSAGYDNAAVSIVLAAGEGAKLPATPFYATWWNRTDYPIPFKDPNREIIRVTAVAGDTLTIVRAQQSTAASTKNTAGKSYVLGRFPKDFMVISATRESPEQLPAGLQRQFVLQEYYPNDYRDTDHDVPQTPSGAQPTSTFAGPRAPILQLAQSTIAGAGDTLITKILGTIYFSAFPTAQTAKIFVTKPGGSEQDTGIVVAPGTGSNVGSFEFIPDVTGEYQFGAEAIAASGAIGGSARATITLGDVLIESSSSEILVESSSGEILTGV